MRTGYSFAYSQVDNHTRVAGSSARELDRSSRTRGGGPGHLLAPDSRRSMTHCRTYFSTNCSKVRHNIPLICLVEL
ncbi:hypothetical protein RSAG8_09036, partial [Rhizoctonia solani AG-8 WAC10335]